MTGTTPATTSRPIWLLVARREIRVRARSKMLWASTAAMVALIVGGVLALHFLSDRPTTYRVAVTSPAGADIVRLAGTGRSDVTMQSRVYPDPAAATAAVRAGTVDAALQQDGEAGWSVEGKSQPSAELSGALAQTAQAVAIDRNARALDVPPATITRGAVVVPVALDAGADNGQYQYGVAFAFGLLFFLSCQLFGTTISSSVVEEKESRVVEVLLAAIPTRALLVGKVVGNALLGVAQMVLFAATALIAAGVVGNVPHLDAISTSTGWFLLGYVLGFGTVCCLFAGLGALASRSQDVQAATAPLQLIITATYMCSFVAKGTVLTVVSFVPIVSSVTMPARIFAGGVPWWQVAVSFSLAAMFAALCIPVAARAYHSSLLRTDGRVPLLQALRGGPAQVRTSAAG